MKGVNRARCPLPQLMQLGGEGKPVGEKIQDSLLAAAALLVTFLSNPIAMLVFGISVYCSMFRNISYPPGVLYYLCKSDSLDPP